MTQIKVHDAQSGRYTNMRYYKTQEGQWVKEAILNPQYVFRKEKPNFEIDSLNHLCLHNCQEDQAPLFLRKGNLSFCRVFPLINRF